MPFSLLANCFPHQKIFEDEFPLTGGQRFTADATGNRAIIGFRSSFGFDDLIKRTAIRAAKHTHPPYSLPQVHDIRRRRPLHVWFIRAVSGVPAASLYLLRYVAASSLVSSFAICGRRDRASALTPTRPLTINERRVSFMATKMANLNAACRALRQINAVARSSPRRIRAAESGELIDDLARFVPDHDDRSGLPGPAIF